MRALKRKKWFPQSAGVAGTAALAFVLAGCAGTAGTEGDVAGSNGYEYGASAEEVKAAFAEVEPITLTFQDQAMSDNDPVAIRGIEFKENIEELSDGKITIERVHSGGVVSFDEMVDALGDGRLDFATLTGVYYPNEFPVFNSMVPLTNTLPNSPFAGELAATAAMTEVWWESEELLAELESHSVHPILIHDTSAPIYPFCETEFGEADDYQGAMIRGASSVHIKQIEAMGASPVSVDYSEVYEGLQRGVFNCAMVSQVGVTSLGLAEIAPHMIAPSGTSIARGSGIFAAGVEFDSLPLVAQQLIFDQAANLFVNSRVGEMEAMAQGIASIRANNGTFNDLPDSITQQIQDANEQMIQDEVAAGRIPDDMADSLMASYEKWAAVAEELECVDKGGFEDFDAWYSRDICDIDAFADQLFEEAFLERRPSSE